MKDVTVRTLGPLRIEREGRKLHESLSRKAQALLVYLACERRPIAREVLTTILWENSPAEQGMTNLRKTLSELRRLLPDQLYADRQVIGLEPQGTLWLDAAEMARLLHEETPPAEQLTQATTAVSLYQGDFLADFFLPDSADFMLWAATRREQLQQMAINALHGLTGHCLQQRRYDEGVLYAQQLVQLDPLNETAHRTFMRLLARAGQGQRALAHYESYCRRLAAELRLTPTPATQALFEQIQTAVTRKLNLPLIKSSFVGRAGELAQVNQYLADPLCRWLSLIGPGGVGKTRLALQAATACAYDFLHGAHFVSLAAVTSPTTLVPTIATALNIPLTGAETPWLQLLNYLRQKEMLLVLDNCETLLSTAMEEAAGQLPHLLAQAPHVRILATSRERFNYQEEHVITVQGLPVERTTTGDALQLLLERAVRILPDFAITAETAPYLRQICQLVEGLPLGIELAAASLAAYSPAQIVAEITQTVDFLGHDSPAGRHNSLRAVFESSWQRLSPVEKETYMRLSIFPGAFTMDAANSVASAAPLNLLAFVDKSMLRLENERYQLHELLRQFAAEKLTAAEKTAVQARFGRYFAHFLQQQSRTLSGAEQQQALHALDGEIDNVRAAWQWLVAHGAPDEVAQALPALHLYYDMRGWFMEGESSFRLAVEQRQTMANDAAGQALLGRLLARLGFFHERLSVLEAASERLQASLVLLRRHDLPQEEAFVLNHLGLVAYAQGEYEKAEAFYQDSLEMSRRATDSGDFTGDQEATTLVNLGALVREQGQYERARRLIQEGLALHQRSGKQREQAIALQVLGSVAETEGAYAEAQEQFQQSLAICERIDDRLGRAILSGSLGNIARRQQALSEAGIWLQQALTLFQEIGDPWGIAISSVRLGELALAMADYERAQGLFQESLAICQKGRDQRGTAVSLCNLGQAALALGQLTQARAMFSEAIRTAATIQFLPLLLKAITGLAQLLAQTTETSQALALAAFAGRHPAVDDETREQALALLTVLTSQMAAAEGAEAQARGRQLDIPGVVALL